MALKPFEHQANVIVSTQDLEYYALLWEMRVGKTLPIIRTAIHNYNKGKVTACLVVAPSGVHINWSRKAIPEDRGDSDNIIEWSSGKAKGKGFQKAFHEAIASKKFLWLCVNVESLQTETLREAIDFLTTERPTMLVVDEAHTIKTPAAKRTKYLLKMAKHFPIRRILTGTPITQGPFDLWAPFKVLHPDILGAVFVPFKQRYGIFRRVRFGGPAFDQLVGYKDLEHLAARIKPYSSRLTQKDVWDKLPELVMERRYFELSAVQRKTYDDLKTDLIVQLDGGEYINAQQAIVALIRLQQISRGYVSNGEDMFDLGSPKPSANVILDLMDEVTGKVIIWCRFTNDVDTLIAAFKEAKIHGVRYDGQVELDQRAINLDKFNNDPTYRVLVGTPATGGIGIDLSAADTMVFYSHNYRLDERLQAIARMQGPKQKSKSLLLIDLVGADTADEKVLDAITRKEDLSATITGDRLRQILGDK